MARPHTQSTLIGPATASLAAAAAFLFAAPAVAGDPADDAGPVLAAARKAVADGRYTQSKLQGFSLSKEAFDDLPPDGGVLIGFDLGVGKFLNIENIYALRAVYLTPGGDEVEKEHGLFRNKALPKNKVIKTKVLRTVHLRAQPGYAVGGVTLRTGLNINGLSVTFMRMRGKALDSRQSYESEWVGDRTGGGEASLGGDGAPVVGVFGSQDDEKVCALGLYFADEPAPAAAPPPAEQPAPAAVAPPAPAPALPPRVEEPAEAPPPKADPPAEAAAPEAEPVLATPKAAAPAAPQPSASAWLVYAVPVAAFLAVTGLVAVAALSAVGRKAPPPAKRKPSRPAVAARPPARPSTAVVAALAADAEVLELGPDDIVEVLELGPNDFDPPLSSPMERAGETPKASPLPQGDWPRLEL